MNASPLEELREAHEAFFPCGLGTTEKGKRLCSAINAVLSNPLPVHPETLEHEGKRYRMIERKSLENEDFPLLVVGTCYAPQIIHEKSAHSEGYCYGVQDTGGALYREVKPRKLETTATFYNTDHGVSIAWGNGTDLKQFHGLLNCRVTIEEVPNGL